jgi:hypothetical protein
MKSLSFGRLKLAMLKLLIVLVAWGSSVAGTEAQPHDNPQERLHIWVKAFIPSSLAGDSEYVKPVPNRPGCFMIPDPVSPNISYLTDNRGFSSNPTASARLTTEFVLVIDESSARIEKANGREYHRCDPSERLNALTGATIAKATATPSVPGTGEFFSIGGPHVAGSKTQVIFQCSAKNPVLEGKVFALVAPNIDYSLDLTYDRSTKHLTYRGSIGRFPSFEAYVSRGNGPTKTLFRESPPPGADARALYDLGTGVGDRAVSGEVVVN